MKIKLEFLDDSIKTYGLLDSLDKFRFKMFLLFQVLLALFDFVILAILSALSFSAAAYLGLTKLPSWALNILNALNLGGLETQKLVFILLLISTILILAKSIIGVITLRNMLRFLSDCAAKVSIEFFDKYMNSDSSIKYSSNTNEMNYAISRGLNLSEILSAFVIIVCDAISLIVIGVFLSIFNFSLAIFIVCYFIFVGILMQVFLRSWVTKNSKMYLASSISSDQILRESFALNKEIMVLKKYDFFKNKFGAQRLAMTRSMANLELNSYLPKYILEALLFLSVCLIGVQQHFTSSSSQSIPMILFFLVAGARILPSLTRLQTALGTIKSVSSDSRFARNLLQDLSRVSRWLKELNLTEEIASGGLQIELKNVSFSYATGNSFAIANLNLSLDAGATLGIVGPTGSGKSTLVDLLLGVLEPTFGSIKIGNLRPIQLINRNSGLIGYVPQNTNFINGTIRENVALGVPSDLIDDIRVLECLQIASLQSYLEDQDLGIYTLVGENGLTLSGGQRQRLGIARALYTNPKILVLDEATSALDAETEYSISQTLANLPISTTKIVVAHRIASLREFSNIIYMSNGNVIAQGSFSEIRKIVPSFDQQAKLMGL